MQACRMRKPRPPAAGRLGLWQKRKACHETNSTSLSEMPEHKSDCHGIAGATDVRTAAGRHQSDGTAGLVLLGVQTSMDGGGFVQSVSRGTQLCSALRDITNLRRVQAYCRWMSGTPNVDRTCSRYQFNERRFTNDASRNITTNAAMPSCSRTTGPVWPECPRACCSGPPARGSNNDPGTGRPLGRVFDLPSR